jgi:hypothetical protein
MTGISETGAIQRVARVLAGQRLSANAKGSDPSAAEDIDAIWPNFIQMRVQYSERCGSQTKKWPQQETLRCGRA